MAASFASIGGAGSFDGIFISGIAAVLLAWVVAGRIDQGGGDDIYCEADP